MATTIAKSHIDKIASTDEMIFKRALKRMYGLNAEQMLSYWPTVQNINEIIKPDGTIALTNEDIRLVKGDPLRTSTGVLEFKEASPTENFPIKVPLESIKYDAESFLSAVDSNFEEYTIANVKTLRSFDTPKISLLDEDEIETDEDPFIVDFRSDPDDKEIPTATKEFGAEAKLLTKVNSAGDKTGISGTIWLIWKGFRYKFQDSVEGVMGEEFNVPPAQDVDGDHTTDWHGSHQQVLPPYDTSKQIVGLTNSIAGRNLEVFLKDRGITYTDIKIVPAAVIDAIPYSDTVFQQSIAEAEVDEEQNERGGSDQSELEGLNQFGRKQTDGFQYNTKEIVYNEITYEPGDIIKTVQGSKRTLPTNHTRWTEHHPYWTAKPVHKDITYKPDYLQKNAKTWEGEAIVGYYQGLTNKEYKRFEDGFQSDDLSKHFMVIRGEWRNINPFNLITSYQGTPASRNPEDPTDWTPGGWNSSKKEGTLMQGFHGNSYKVLGWEQMRYMAPGLSLQDGDWDLERFIDTFDDEMPRTIKVVAKENISRSTFPGGDGQNPRSYGYAKTGLGVNAHYFKGSGGRFKWPYDIPGTVKMRGKFMVDKTGSGDRGFGIYLRVYDSDGTRIFSEHTGGRKTNNRTTSWYTGGNSGMIYYTMTMNKGDEVHLEIKQDSSKRKLRLEDTELDVTITLRDLHDTVELEKEVLVAKPLYENPPGMVCAAGNLSANKYRAYIQDGSYYNQPHLEKYNELFSAKTPSSPQKKT